MGNMITVNKTTTVKLAIALTGLILLHSIPIANAARSIVSVFNAPLFVLPDITLWIERFWKLATLLLVTAAAVYAFELGTAVFRTRCTNLADNTTRRLLAITALAAIIVAFCWVYIGFLNLNTDGGYDLRSRIVGARAMQAGLSPYFFRWSEAYPDTLSDPLTSELRIVNRCTYTPVMLLLTLSISWMQYSSIKILWLFVQYACFFGILCYFFRAAGTPLKKGAVILAGVFLFIGTPAWTLHIKLGQIYILYPFLLTVAYAVARSTLRWREEVAGMLMGITVWLRPPMVMALVPFIINKKTRIIKGGALGILLCLLVSLSYGHLSLWKEYFNAMTEWGRLATGEMTLVDAQWHNPPLYTEGEFTGSLLVTQRIDPLEYFLSVQHYAFSRLGIELYAPALLSMFAFLACVLLFLWRKYPPAANNETMFLCGYLLVMLLEYFLPAPRYVYYYVQWIFPALLIIVHHERFPRRLLALFAAGMVLCCMEELWIYGETMLFVVTLALISRQNPSSLSGYRRGAITGIDHV